MLIRDFGADCRRGLRPLPDRFMCYLCTRLVSRGGDRHDARQDSRLGCGGGGPCPAGPSGSRRRLPGAEGGQLGGSRLPVPHRRGAARAAPALPTVGASTGEPVLSCTAPPDRAPTSHARFAGGSLAPGSRWTQPLPITCRTPSAPGNPPSLRTASGDVPAVQLLHMYRAVPFARALGCGAAPRARNPWRHADLCGANTWPA